MSRDTFAKKGTEGGVSWRFIFTSSVVTSGPCDGEDKPLRIRSRCTRASDSLRIVRAGITTCNWIMKAAIVINVASFLRREHCLLLLYRASSIRVSKVKYSSGEQTLCLITACSKTASFWVAIRLTPSSRFVSRVRCFSSLDFPDGERAMLTFLLFHE